MLNLSMDWIFSTYGALAAAPSLLVTLAWVVALVAPIYLGWRLWHFTGLFGAMMWLSGPSLWVWFVVGIPLFVINVPPIRRTLLTARVLQLLKSAGLLPQISETERTAIAAGNVWLDGELFSGHPSMERLATTDYPGLTNEEQAFLDGPVARVCEMTDDWQVWQERDLPATVWDYLKRERFFGMIVPKEYDGLGLSPSANSAVVSKLSSRSLPLAITVMVPNSLGPAELLIHYGTQAQKDHWLPRLARGEEIPCFALTEPGAGSDAGAIQARGVVFRDESGRAMLRLTWDKRYITLAAVSTVLGLAFNLHDPENLLGKGPTPGITCALIPTNTPGVTLGRRHDPLGVPFYNCPTTGKDVIVPLEDAVIGGSDGCGQGWRMLMECLSAGRGISLPATSAGGAQLAARTVGAYAAVRKQFGLPIGKFEGIEEPLARIAGFNYVLEASRRYTCGGLDSGAKPAVVTAIMKYNSTELWRQIVNDGMDVLGGAAISRGPRNLLAHGYIGTPICVTVEGANILTRTLMIFGQGAIRCHPYAYEEIEALTNNDLGRFDKSFWPHIGHVLRNGVRSVLLGLTRGRLSASPVSGQAAPYWRKLAWSSATFAFWSEVAMGTLGGDLKRKEKLTGRFADAFSWLYLGAAVLRRFEAEGRRPEDVPLMQWSMEHAFAQIQQATEGLMQNLKVPGMSWLLRGPVSWLARLNPISRGPNDSLGQKVAKTLLQPGELRDRLTPTMHVPMDSTSALGRLEHALTLSVQVDEVHRKMREGVKSGRLPKARPEKLLDQACEIGLITDEERTLAREAEAARAEAIAVDSFTLEEYLNPGATADKPASAPAAVKS
ncbi:MAG: acyl-CoA dehydrogenase [Planctomycetota bacterium]|nr:acyl-CoA dehydrogenase [Planctomycetota bacterium]